MNMGDLWDPVAGEFRSVEINRRERSVSADMNTALAQAAEPAAWPWLEGVEASIVEAQKHEGPLDGRKMIGDMARLMMEVRSRIHDLEYSRKRANEADQEVERLRAEAKEQAAVATNRAAELRRRDGQIIQLKMRAGEAGPPTLVKMSIQLGRSRARVEESEAEIKRLRGALRDGAEIVKAQLKQLEIAKGSIEVITSQRNDLEKQIKRSKPLGHEVDAWKIWEYCDTGGQWWGPRGTGYTTSRHDAHKYTSEEAWDILRRAPGLNLKLVHISEASPE